MSRLIALLLTAACLAGAWPAVARAGGYDVYACDSGVAGGANNSFIAQADNGMAAYADCPAGQGLVTRNVYDGGQTGFLQGAYLIFDAPGGSTVESITYEGGLERHHCSWTVAMIAGGYDLGGRLVWGNGGNSGCDGWQTPGGYFPVRWSYNIGAPRVRIEARCASGTCPRNGVAAVRIRNVRVRVRDDNAPTLSNGRGGLWRSDNWLAGAQSVGFDATDGSGIREAIIRIDGREVARRTFACDPTRPAPCPSAGVDESFTTAGFGADGLHTLTLEAVDAGGNPTSESRTIRVDNSPPDPPKGLSLEGASGWRSTNDFTLRWTVSSPVAGSQVAAAEWELCPVEGTTCTRGSRPGRNIAALEHFKVPAPGAYDLKLWLRDEAGNEDRRLAAAPVRLQYDDASPEVVFEPLSSEDPTLLSARTTDKGSGVAGGSIEMRRVGSPTWLALPTTLESGRLLARIDDERLGDGVFELRARAADHAGNERSTEQRADGEKATVTLPLRLKTRLRGGMVVRRSGHARLATSAYARYGQLVRVRGRLTTPEGNPVQDVEVQAFTQVRDASTPPRLIATVRTSRSGRFTFLVRKGPSRAIRIRYGGTQHIRAATRIVVLNVRSRTTMRPSRRRLVNGETVRFRGRIATGRIPSQGKLVELQVWVRGRWRTFATTRAGARGTWHYDYRFDGTRGRQTYRFRARVPPETGYPFAAGRSRVVRVRVAGV